MRLYKDDRGLCRRVARFVHAGLLAGQPAVVIATDAHVIGIRRELEVLDRDAAELEAAGELQCLDAPALLDTFMLDGQPDLERFRSVARGVLRGARRGRDQATVYVYGEMVDILWRAGRADAALRLEVLWSQLAAVESFSLLCGYAEGSFYQARGLEALCALHTHVEPTLLEPISPGPELHRKRP
ncbi:MAG TPA: MEDS domain-containing protein [Vicinamibacterales bacterium]